MHTITHAQKVAKTLFVMASFIYSASHLYAQEFYQFPDTQAYEIPHVPSDEQTTQSSALLTPAQRRELREQSWLKQNSVYAGKKAAKITINYLPHAAVGLGTVYAINRLSSSGNPLLKGIVCTNRELIGLFKILSAAYIVSPIISGDNSMTGWSAEKTRRNIIKGGIIASAALSLTRQSNIYAFNDFAQNKSLLNYFRLNSYLNLNTKNPLCLGGEGIQRFNAVRIGIGILGAAVAYPVANFVVDKTFDFVGKKYNDYVVQPVDTYFTTQTSDENGNYSAADDYTSESTHNNS